MDNGDRGLHSDMGNRNFAVTKRSARLHQPTTPLYREGRESRFSIASMRQSSCIRAPLQDLADAIFQRQTVLRVKFGVPTHQRIYSEFGIPVAIEIKE
jgi:hypothetical protein